MFPRNRVDCIRWITFILYLMTMLTECEVEAVDKKYKPKQKRRRSNRGRKTGENLDLSSGMWIVAVLLATITVPTLLYFVYSVVKDPATPSVLKEAWDVAKIKYFGYINQFSAEGTRSDHVNERSAFDRAMMSGADEEEEGPASQDNILHRM